jgi:hypothetical protein
MELTFQLGNEMILVRILNRNITFATAQTNFQHFVPIDCLRLSKDGILKEHPDLKNLSDGKIRQEGLKRFKEHINNLGGEEKIKDYVVEELRKSGYVLKIIKKEGFRPIKVK